MREAPSRVVIEQLLALGAKIQVYDPEAMKEARKIFGKKIRYSKSNYEALRGAAALILVTEWNEFRNPDFKKMTGLLYDLYVVTCSFPDFSQPDRRLNSLISQGFAPLSKE